MPEVQNALPQDLAACHALIEKLRCGEAEQRRRAEQAENNERCFRELAEHIREVFWMTNALGDELVYISPAYEHIWGQTCDSLYDDPGRRLAWVHDADRERVLKAFKEHAANGDFDQTYRIDRPDGEIRWIRDRAFPVYDSDGELYRLAGFAIDITDHVNDRDHLTELHSTLAARERISIFAALGTGLTHDLSQPLTAARTYIEQARRSGNQAGRALDNADQEIERAADIIRHLRDFARKGKPTLQMQPVAPMLDDLQRLLDPAMRANDIRYTGPAPNTLGNLELPLDLIFAQQVLRNLMTNAIEAFDEENGNRRDITVSVDAANAEHVEIAVSDNGSGIDDDVDLFSPFATTKADGLGLGLAVSRSLARSHGGDLYIDSRGGGAQGDGRTCFVLRLPRSAD